MAEGAGFGPDAPKGTHGFPDRPGTFPVLPPSHGRPRPKSRAAVGVDPGSPGRQLRSATRVLAAWGVVRVLPSPKTVSQTVGFNLLPHDTMIQIRSQDQ